MSKHARARLERAGPLRRHAAAVRGRLVRSTTARVCSWVGRGNIPRRNSAFPFVRGQRGNGSHIRTQQYSDADGSRALSVLQVV